MGVLDDAIREHLDLKRRHGVAEEELRRQEEEALGPARREVAPAETDEEGNGAGAEAAPEPPLAEHDEPELSEALPESAVRSDLHDHEPLDEAPPRTDDAPQPGFEDLDDDELLVEEAPPREDEPPPLEDPLARDEPADEDEPPEGEDPDLLEDTPDFLQETPEHDRLWFEQKPPRDFDFD
jgi:hypothetical protein